MLFQHNKDTRAIVIGFILIILVIIIFIIRLSFFNQNNNNVLVQEKESTNQNLPQIEAITPTEIIDKIKTGDQSFIFIDVRTREAYDNEHIINSISIPYGDFSNISPRDDQTVIIIFSHDQRDVIAAIRERLSNISFRVKFLKGGFEAWKNDHYGYLISKGDPDSFIDASKVSYLDPKEFSSFINDNPKTFILDLQSPENFFKKHIKNAVNIQLKDIEKKRNEIPAGKFIIIYSDNDLVSFQAGVRLFDLNSFMVKIIGGDFQQLKEDLIPKTHIITNDAH